MFPAAMADTMDTKRCIIAQKLPLTKGDAAAAVLAWTAMPNEVQAKTTGGTESRNERAKKADTTVSAMSAFAPITPSIADSDIGVPTTDGA